MQDEFRKWCKQLDAACKTILVQDDNAPNFLDHLWHAHQNGFEEEYKRWYIERFFPELK